MDQRGAKRLLAAAMAGSALAFCRPARADDKLGCTHPSWAAARPPEFEIADCGEKAWMSMDVVLKKGVRTLRGSRSDVAYRLKDPSKAVAAAATRSFFVSQAEDAGGVLASDPRDESVAVVQRKAPDGLFWYLYRPGGVGVGRSTDSFTLTTVRIAPLAQEVKARSTAGAWETRSVPCSNPPWLLKQFPYFKPDSCDGRDFDVLSIDLSSGPKILAGHVIDTRYALVDAKKSPSAIAVWKNYVGALRAIGATLASDPQNHSRAVLTQTTTQGEFWYVYQQTDGDDDDVSAYQLTSAQSGGPTPGSCTLEIYGLDFEPGKAALRPDSMPVLTQLLAMFRNDPAFAAEIGGHSDDKGDRIADRRLSGARADELKTWLTVNGIAGTRLTTVGYGDSAPLAPNTSDENRARNRRFELKRTGCKP